eukprot:2131227-Pleurochrysis_carterae.AAC.1
MVCSSETNLPGLPVKISATKKGWERKRSILRARATAKNERCTKVMRVSLDKHKARQSFETLLRDWKGAEGAGEAHLSSCRLLTAHPCLRDAHAAQWFGSLRKCRMR